MFPNPDTFLIDHFALKEEFEEMIVEAEPESEFVHSISRNRNSSESPSVAVNKETQNVNGHKKCSCGCLMWKTTMRETGKQGR